MLYFGGRDAEALAGRVEEMADDGPLVLERTTLWEVQLDLHGGHMHRSVKRTLWTRGHPDRKSTVVYGADPEAMTAVPDPSARLHPESP